MMFWHRYTRRYNEADRSLYLLKMNKFTFERSSSEATPYKKYLEMKAQESGCGHWNKKIMLG